MDSSPPHRRGPPPLPLEGDAADLPVPPRAVARHLRRAGRDCARPEPRPRSPRWRSVVTTAQIPAVNERRAISLFRRDIVRRALIDSLIKLDPRVQVRNPLMFVVEIGAAITTVTWLIQVFGGGPLGGGHEAAWYTFMISIWLSSKVVVANMAGALADGRGRAQAHTMRSMRQEPVAKLKDGSTKQAPELTKGD